MGDYLLSAQFDGYLESYAKRVWFLKAMQKDCCCSVEEQSCGCHH